MNKNQRILRIEYFNNVTLNKETNHVKENIHPINTISQRIKLRASKRLKTHIKFYLLIKIIVLSVITFECFELIKLLFFFVKKFSL